MNKKVYLLGLHLAPVLIAWILNDRKQIYAVGRVKY